MGDGLRNQGLRWRQFVVSLTGTAMGLALGWAGVPDPWAQVPYVVVVLVVGLPLVGDVAVQLRARQGGADLLAAVTMATAALMGEWLVGAIIALMLSGGEALEDAATRRATSVLAALARRAPSVAHVLTGADPSEGTRDVPADEVPVGTRLVVLPHELCPADGEVVQGHGTMDESYLTGEPYEINKGPGSAVMSGAVNGESALVVRTTRIAADSRYAQIAGVLAKAEGERPPMRRIADRLGGWYTVFSLGLALAAWLWSGDSERFLSVMVLATPCPLLIGVPVAIIGAISASARNGIIVKSPAMLEEVSRCPTVLFDKTGTLTYGRPELVGVELVGGLPVDEVLALAAALETYSRHPLSAPVVAAAKSRGLDLPPVDRLAEHPGAGLTGMVGGLEVVVTGRAQAERLDAGAALPGRRDGLECVVLVDGTVGAVLHFRDTPRSDARAFIEHLRPRHGVTRTLIVSGDREAEVQRLADLVGIDEAHGGVSPEGKLALVREETARAQTMFLGDGINDAPAMTAATVGIAFGAASDITTEAADAVVLDSSLERLDELLHIGGRMRRIALQTAVGGISASLIGMSLAAVGLIPPVMGAVLQEVIDVLAVLNSARVAARRSPMTDLPRSSEGDAAVPEGESLLSGVSTPEERGQVE